MAWTYKQRLRLAEMTVKYVKTGAWPDAWGPDTKRNKLMRIKQRKLIAAATEPEDIAPFGHEYTNALYDYAMLTVKAEYGERPGPRWRKIPAELLKTALELADTINQYKEK